MGKGISHIHARVVSEVVYSDLQIRVFTRTLLGPELDRRLRDTETEAKAQLFGKLIVRLLGNHDVRVYKVCCNGSCIRVLLGKHMRVLIWGWECSVKVLHEKTLELDCEGSVAVT